MNIIQAVQQLKYKLEPKPENGGKSKNFYPNEKDFIAINLIMEFVQKSLIDNQSHKDLRLQKLYLILFNIYLKEYECPITAENKINELYKKPLTFQIFKIKSMLDSYYIENSKDLNNDIKEMELSTEEVIKAIKLNMNNLFILSKDV